MARAKNEGFKPYDGTDREEVKQFPVKIEGETIYVQPKFVDNTGAFKRPDVLEYMKEHHPNKAEKYAEYENAHKAVTKRLGYN